MDHSAANIVMECFIAKGWVQRPGQTAVWPAYLSMLPAVPDQVVAFTDTSGILQGRLQQSGLTISKPGVQIRVRALTYPPAAKRTNFLFDNCDLVKQELVVFEGKSYKLHAIKKIGTPAFMGPDPNNQRMNLSINLLVTITEN